jgi:hypothetical protein
MIYVTEGESIVEFKCCVGLRNHEEPNVKVWGNVVEHLILYGLTDPGYSQDKIYVVHENIGK